MDDSHSLVAEEVVVDVTEFTRGCVVHLIGFRTGNPESGGEAWHFSRSSSDDWGVCTVREIQQVVLYDGIESFELGRHGLKCVFEPKAATQSGWRELRIAFSVDHDRWVAIAEAARVIFKDRAWFAMAGSA